ncbi:MAG: aminomethyl-transferring glycine dehydrogenase subunit GcvPA [Armatimonadetes bacterium]|nr:aminomethyl-transferring glycine dehydrogenase subunit GcvPA [Armatimonadota bacterium]
MPYIPHTEADTQKMLDTIGVKSIDDLFIEIPDNLRVKGQLNVPSAKDEAQLFQHCRDLAERNVDLSRTTCFLGAGIYDRFSPATVGAVISRGEFLTAYTPYQPEASQGYLQTIYEFQSMIAELYGMDVANASMYDGTTSLAEAAIMATYVNKRKKVYVSGAIHPHAREVLNTYCWAMDVEVVEIRTQDGVTKDYSIVKDDAACVLLQTPNFFGCIEDMAVARDAARANGALFIVSADPVAFGLLKPPGDFDADIVVGEGQPLGLPMGFGGPLLGLFACKKEYVRLIPGRIVGRTVDGEGRSGFTMTLRTREQDIRREKATSNICTNEALMALASTVHMSALGKNGIRQVAESTVRNTQYAIQKLKETGCHLKYDQKVFCEFVLSLPKSAVGARDALLEKGILAGLPMGGRYLGDENDLLVAVTELRTRAQIDEFASALKEVLN